MEVYGGFVGQPDVPVGGSDVVSDDGFPCGVAGDLEGEGLAAQFGEGLVGGAPVVAHLNPSGAAPLHVHAAHVSAATHVHDEYQQPVAVPLDEEPDSAAHRARHPAIHSSNFPTCKLN